MTSKARQQALTLLSAAPSDTTYGIVDFVRSKICEPVEVPLGNLTDKTLAKHLEALLSTPMLWGLGDYSRNGEWAAALSAAERISGAANWQLAHALAHFAHLLHTDKPSNREVIALAAWLLDGKLQFNLRHHLRWRVDQAMGRPGIPTHWFSTSWRSQGVSSELLKKETLHLCDGKKDMATMLMDTVW